MGTIIVIILVVAGIGGIIGLLSGGSGEDAAAGAMGGAIFAGSCLFELVMTALVFLAGLWVLSLIFG